MSKKKKEDDIIINEMLRDDILVICTCMCLIFAAGILVGLIMMGVIIR